MSNPRNKAIAWAKSVMDDVENCVVIDTETTGVKETDQVVQVSAVKWLDGKQHVILHTLIRPTVPIHPEASKITGIEDRHVIGCPSFAEISPAIRQIIVGHRCIAYNAAFDERLLQQSWSCGDSPRSEWECAMLHYAAFNGEWNSYRESWAWIKLVNAMRQLGMEPKWAHSAVGDCIMTWKVIEAMAKAEVSNENGT